MLRPALKFLVMIAVVWGIWWVVASGFLRGSIDAWLDARRAAGWQIETGEITREGFPLRIASTVPDVTVTSAPGPDSLPQSVLYVPQISLSTPVYWPGEITLDLPESPVTLDIADRSYALTSQGLDATMHLMPGISLELDFMRASSARITVEDQGTDLAILGIGSLHAEIRHAGAPQTYDVDVAATGLELGDIVTSGIDLPDTWPSELGPLIAELQVVFDRPWDRAARRDTLPQPRLITVETISARYADTEFSLDGTLSVDAGGVPTGSLRLRLSGARDLFDRAAASAQGTPPWARNLESVLNFIPLETVEQVITFERGQMRMGFIPLGPAPVLRIP
jgi:hypothetical protein